MPTSTSWAWLILDSRLEAASKKQLPYADFLADLLGIETSARRERYLRTRTALAHFPFQALGGSPATKRGKKARM